MRKLLLGAVAVVALSGSVDARVFKQGRTVCLGVIAITGIQSGGWYHFVIVTTIVPLMDVRRKAKRYYQFVLSVSVAK